MPLTNPYPGPRSVLIMGNCRIHHGERVRALVEDMYCELRNANVHFFFANGLSVCKLLYLPPYSPDYNPIEQAFSAIKAHLRRCGRDPPMMSIVRACQSITREKAAGYFKASGYII